MKREPCGCGDPSCEEDYYMGKQREPEIPDIERGAGYAEALIEQSIVDRVPTSVLLYAAAIILHGKSSSIEDAIATIREVATYR